MSQSLYISLSIVPQIFAEKENLLSIFIQVLESKFYCLMKVSVFLSKIKLYLIINYIPFSQGIFSKLIVMSN